MGVTGLWRLLEPAGKPVPLETLEGKVLAVDISIWLHQMVKGYQDARGGTVVNAHLLGLFQRLCKLLYYKIKPVFVFDGGVPVLKIQTISKRQSKKSQMHNTVDRMRKQLLEIVTKQMAVSKIISEKKDKSPKKRSPTKPTLLLAYNDDDTLFKLPPIEVKEASVDESDSDSEDVKPTKLIHMDLHSLDVNSQYFKSLTPREKHDLLTELKETRKQSSWGRIHELPSQSDSFSNYQMQRLLKRRQVQVSLEETEKEMGGHYLSLNELEVLLNEEGIDTHIESLPTRQIASDENTHFILIKDIKEAIENATKKELQRNNDDNKEESDVKNPEPANSESNIGLGKEYNEDLEAALKLSLECFDAENQPSSSKMSVPAQDSVDLSFIESGFTSSDSSDSEWETDSQHSEPEENNINTNLALVKAYMLENSGLTEREIKRIIGCNTKKTPDICTKKSPVNDEDGVTQHRTTSSLITGISIAPCEAVPCINLSESESKITVKSQDSKLLSEKIQCNAVSTIINTEENGRGKNACDSMSVSINNIPQVGAVELSAGLKTSDPDNVALPNKIQPCSETSDIPHISQLREIVEMSSDSDDSFEEVKDEVEEHSNVGVKLNFHVLPQDDIFADIFTNGIHEDGKEKSVSSSNSQVSLSAEGTPLSTTQDKTKIYTNTPENNSVLKESGIQSMDTGSVIKQIVSVNDSKGVLHNDYVTNADVSTEEVANNNVDISSHNSIEASPRKGMTLNEVRHLASQEESEIKGKNQYDLIEKQLISTDELITIADDLEEQKEKLQREQSKLDRMGRNISEEMTKDVQYLLKLFGIPYIIAPMEAEAQCAFLEAIKLTDGTITDDSDIWLFGGKSVYKNFFNQQKHVLQFLSENIENCFNLSREQLVLLALLVGSDYTTGVSGVGPVTAMEILSTFPPPQSQDQPPYSALLQGLKKFKSWWNDSRAYGHGKLRSKLRNISINQEFPSYKVVEAYLVPQVNKSDETFSWGKPDVTALRDFTKQKFGWPQTKTDEILKPVLKRLDEKISQQSIRSFFRTEIKNVNAMDGMSKRVRDAVKRMGNDAESEDDQEFKSKAKKVRKGKGKKTLVVPSTKDDVSSTVENKTDEMSVDCNPQLQFSSNVCKISDNNTVVVTESRKRDVKPFIPGRYQETIPQRESDKTLMMKNKLKAIELFRTSKKGPGFIKKRGKTLRQPKLEAELSESDSN